MSVIQEPAQAEAPNEPDLSRLIDSRLADGSSQKRPFFSILTPTWNTRPSWFRALAISILAQDFDAWEWCIVDDNSSTVEFLSTVSEVARLPNVHFKKLEQGAGISGATNFALAAAAGEFICCVDHDDVLSPSALLSCAKALATGADSVYTDSDKMDEAGERYEPFHKPCWSPEFFRGVMYVGHLLCVRASLARAVGGFDSYFDGVQDYEFFLRVSERTAKIEHVAEVLYHWRAVAGSVAAQSEAKGDLGKLQREAVQAHLDRLKLPALAVMGTHPHRVSIKPLPQRPAPRVSIIIPTKDNPTVLRKCLYSLFAKTRYENFEVLCVDNESSNLEAVREMRDAPVKHILFPGKFNFSRANNLALQQATGDYIVCMNNDIETLTDDWIDHMLYYAEQPDVGAVGALLLYPNGSVQHAGVVLGCRGTADHVLRFCPGDSDGYAGSLSCARECSAVTAACLMVTRVIYDQVSGFNEHFFTHYQDVDLCLKIRSLGKRIIYTPHARFVHHESVSRGTYYDLVDRNLLLDRWESTIDKGDPYFNVNFNVQACDYSR